MKKLWLLLLLSTGYMTTLHAQQVYQIRADSVRIYNVCDTAELILENRTQDTLGFLFNKGKGRTEFRRLRFNDVGNGKISFGNQDTLDFRFFLGGNFIQNQYGTAQNAGYWVKGPGRVDSTFMVSRYKNNISEDSLLSTNTQGELKLVHKNTLTNIYNSNGTLTGQRIVNLAGNYLSFLGGGGLVIGNSSSDWAIAGYNYKLITTGPVSVKNTVAVRSTSDDNALFGVSYLGTNVSLSPFSGNSPTSMSFGYANQGIMMTQNGSTWVGDFGNYYPNSTLSLGGKVLVLNLRNSVNDDSVVTTNTGGLLKMRYMPIKGPGVSFNTNIITGNYTVSNNDYTVINRATSGNPAVTLPSASQNKGRTLILFDDSANRMTWSPAVYSYTGGTGYTSFNDAALSAYRKITIQSDGSNWFIMSAF
ncbi:hypothetical protein HHL17_14500 [Chitinophaga sp. G-6-1-13]|uniref:Uncharacterized protein n=1 Tax=Chitinophaga fulva TaxID=2728842 RepID=A0A848GIJ9_9BACT|nr:hypothetical protein [Chitinophaga fulva]NML38415.1 hypothetical protein [Chitinophaga fulva]